MVLKKTKNTISRNKSIVLLREIKKILIFRNGNVVILMGCNYETNRKRIFTKVDFVAIKRNEKVYIQVSDNISDESTFKREVDSLLKIKDAYPKLLIARTRHEEYTYEGIRVVDIEDWLTDGR